MTHKANIMLNSHHVKYPGLFCDLHTVYLYTVHTSHSSGGVTRAWPVRTIIFHRATVLTFRSIEKCPHELEVMHERADNHEALVGTFSVRFNIPHEKPLLGTFSYVREGYKMRKLSPPEVCHEGSLMENLWWRHFLTKENVSTRGFS